MRSVLKILSFLIVLSVISGCSKDTNNTPSCPPGYTGSNCNTEVAPYKMFLNSVTVLSFPEKNELGEQWDFGLIGYPDMYVDITPYRNGPAYRTTVVENASPSNVYEFPVNPPLQMLNPTSLYKIGLYDYDDTSFDDLIGEVEFVPYLPNTGFPKHIQLNTSNGRCLIEISVAYVWD